MATREEVREWIEEKDKIEARVDVIESTLSSRGFGITGGLIDDEGFPLSDVDCIFEIRSLRNELAMLKNDHIDIMRKIEKGLETCFNE